MTHAIETKQRQLSGIKHFQQFIFINDSAVKYAPNSIKQLHLTPNSNFLSQTDVGSWLTINQLHLPQSIIRQLESLHFQPGERIHLVSKTIKASVMVELKGKLIGIGSEIAHKIVVTLVD